eukprot:jgi/Bigna1/90079/estExt_fgenesh1_pg.C_610116
MGCAPSVVVPPPKDGTHKSEESIPNSIQESEEKDKQFGNNKGEEKQPNKEPVDKQPQPEQEDGGVINEKGGNAVRNDDTKHSKARQKKNTTEENFVKGSIVRYKDRENVTVVGVHHDDPTEVYYTIKKADGDEVNTVFKYLKWIDKDDIGSNAAVDKEKVEDGSAAKEHTNSNDQKHNRGMTTEAASKNAESLEAKDKINSSGENEVGSNGQAGLDKSSKDHDTATRDREEQAGDMKDKQNKLDADSPSYLCYSSDNLLPDIDRSAFDEALPMPNNSDPNSAYPYPEAHMDINLAKKVLRHRNGTEKMVHRLNNG